MLSCADRERLARDALAFGVDLAASQLEQLDGYVERLLTWNSKINLTAVTEHAAIIDKHLLDSLALVPVLAAAPKRVQLLDVGTGPGLPSIVLAIACPWLRITAVESIQKKAMFVRAVARELQLSVAVEALRFEQLDAARTFDVAVSRATFDPPEWVERGAPRVSPNGLLLAMLSAQQAVPVAPANFVALPLVERQIGGAARRVAVYHRTS